MNQTDTAGRIRLRSEVPESDRWDLSGLFADRNAWETGMTRFAAMAEQAAAQRAALDPGAPEAFRAILAAYAECLLLDERLGSWSHLRVTEDEGDSGARGDFSRYVAVATRVQAAWSWLVPSIQALPADFVASCLADPAFADFRVFVTKLLRFKPHILSEAEERILALQTETNQLARETFGILTNVDLDFGTVATPEGDRPLTQSTYASFMRHPDRAVREAAYRRFYGTYEAHANTLASLYAGSAKLDAYQATVRKYPGAREAALFPDDVPTAVYDNLVATVNANLGALHEYYALRTRALGLAPGGLRHWDVYVPMLPEARARHRYDEAVDLISEALAPLGPEYVGTLRAGLLGRWVDRYENRGKRSGAFSAGGFTGEPYILMNYKEDVLRDVFTLAHEGGHSMHSWYSARNNPFLCYSYTIFEAEVASTFNEELLFRHLYERSADRAARASLLASRLDDMLATLFRQTMFAEFEARTHAMLESGTPLTLQALRAEYRALLEKYFGPGVKLEAVSDLEGLRIPHFYNAFYVYKYATGLSASVALAERVLSGGARERGDYFAFLKSGGSRYPIEALKVAGVDMSTPAPVEAACARFASGVRELSSLIA